MDKVLIIKGGGLGDIIQSYGAYMDIFEHHQTKIDVLTSRAFEGFFKIMPFVNNVYTAGSTRKKDIVFWHKVLPTTEYKYVYCLPDFGEPKKKISFNQWSKNLVLDYFVFRNAKLITLSKTISAREIKRKINHYSYTNWSQEILGKLDIKARSCSAPPIHNIVDHSLKSHARKSPYIFIAPYYSESTASNTGTRGWPYFKELMLRIKKDFPHLRLVVVPGPGEVGIANTLPAEQILEHDKVLSIPKLMKVIQDSIYSICLDSGPDKIASALGKKGRVICGKYSRNSQKLGVNTKNFKAMHFSDRELKDVSVDEVYEVIRSDLMDLSKDQN